jgi:hypothetical protein
MKCRCSRTPSWDTLVFVELLSDTAGLDVEDFSGLAPAARNTKCPAVVSYTDKLNILSKIII